jgi:hypothetical protein
MKAKIKATGEIVHVGDYNTISHDPMYKNERTGPWRLEELDFAIDPDYWTRLEHQYAGMAMQTMLATLYNPKYHKELMACYTEVDAKEVARLSKYYAHALVEKMKEERK